jgi:signal transduction histidine kinase
VSYESQISKKSSDRSYKGIPIPDNGISGQSRLLLIVEDVTERKRILAELESLADFPRQNANPVFRVDKHGKVTIRNGKMDELINVWHDAGDLASMDTIEAMAAEVIRTGKRNHVDTSCGNEIYLFDVVPSTDGEYANVYGHDVTAERRVQDMKDHFLSIASHELRTPMTVIGGYSDLMLSGSTGELSEKQRKYIERIDINTHKLLEFVNTMLDINKLESGRFSFHVHEVDVAAIAKTAYDGIASLYEKNGVTLYTELLSMYAMASDEQLGRVITNLLSNALKFTPSGGEVWLKVYVQGEDVIVEVRDTGSGISDEDKKRLFHKYGQASSIALHKMQGTGLGLVISSELMLQMHGRIWAESQLGVGSRFFISLPRI